MEPIPNQTPEVNWRRFWIGMWPDFKNRGRKPYQKHEWSEPKSDSESKGGKSHDLRSRKQGQFQCLRRFVTSILNHNPQLWIVHWSDSESKPRSHLKARKQGQFQCLKQFITSTLNHNPRLRLVHWSDSESNPWSHRRAEKQGQFQMPKAIHHFDSESQPQTPNCSPIRFRIETSDVNCRRFWGERRFPIKRGGQSHDFRARKTRRFQPLPWPFSFFGKSAWKLPEHKH